MIGATVYRPAVSTVPQDLCADFRVVVRRHFAARSSDSRTRFSRSCSDIDGLRLHSSLERRWGLRSALRHVPRRLLRRLRSRPLTQVRGSPRHGTARSQRHGSGFGLPNRSRGRISTGTSLRLRRTRGDKSHERLSAGTQRMCRASCIGFCRSMADRVRVLLSGRRHGRGERHCGNGT